MKLLPFSVRREFKPRDRLGLDSALDPIQRKMLDTLDINQQQTEYHGTLHLIAINGLIVLGFVVFLTHGVDAAIAVHNWILHR